jgi:hypothetical protein
MGKIIFAFSTACAAANCEFDQSIKAVDFSAACAAANARCRCRSARLAFSAACAAANIS